MASDISIVGKFWPDSWWVILRDGGLGRQSSVSSSWLQALSSESSTIVSSSQSLSSGSLWILERQTRQLSNFAIRAVSRKEIVWSEAKFLRGNNLFKMYLDNYDENDYGDGDDRLPHMMSGKESWKRGFKGWAGGRYTPPPPEFCISINADLWTHDQYYVYSSVCTSILCILFVSTLYVHGIHRNLIYQIQFCTVQQGSCGEYKGGVMN